MIFEKVKNELKKNFPELQYKRYIKDLEIDEELSTSDQIILYTQNILLKNYIKRHFLDKLAESFYKFTNIKPLIQIEVKKNKNKIVKTPQIEEKQNISMLNPSFTFESFIVGGSNQFAFTAAKTVAENPGKIYNPLFFYGNTGLGKTHLLQAIGNYLQNKGYKVIYVTSEQFMNEFLHHIRHKTQFRFQEKYRNCDALLIDDIQFFSRKESTQEEFFHTFNELHQSKKQICLTSDVAPSKIIGFEDRLKSRFEWGLIADIQPPELETKIQIIKKKCEIHGIFLNNEIINYIATNLDNNIREIEGIILSINAYAKMIGIDHNDITLEIVKSQLNNHIKSKNENITLEKILKIIAKKFNIKPSEITSKAKKPNIVKARRTGVYLAKNLTTHITTDIAKFFGLKDHSAVSHAFKSFTKELEKNEELRNLVEELENKIKSQINEI